MSVLNPFFGIDISQILNGNNLTVTVSYEALNNASAEVLRNAKRLEATCEQLETLCGKMPSYWESEAEQMNETSLRKQIEQMMEMARKFQSHAQNLQSIAQNYIKTSGDVAGVIQELSSDVIV